MIIENNIQLAQYTTFRIGGRALYFCVVKNEDELVEAVGFSKKNKIPIFILGGGSNILVSDNGFTGIVIKMEIMGKEYIEKAKENADEVKVIVGAGENWDSLVEETVEKKLYGLENLSYIPGTVGATPIQNIGAYGSEAKDTIESVYVLDIKKDEYKVIKNIDCDFSYRDSMFKKEKNRYVIISVTFILNKNGKLYLEYEGLKNIKNPSLKKVRETVIDIRKRKLPDIKEYGTAGSFFKNLIVSRPKAKELLAKYPDMILHEVNDKKVKIPLAWILDHVCGFRGVRIGDVGIYKNQALVIVNYGNATAQDINNLAQKMSKAVYEKAGLNIEPEVHFVV